MRIWSLHPRFLDRQGLLACWRETLLAQKVLAGLTKGYRNHPQLARFREMPDPSAAIGTYLAEVAAEAARRGYNFDTTKIARTLPGPEQMEVSTEQLAYEWEHLLRKLRTRSPELYERTQHLTPEAHPLFRVVAGPIADWEIPISTY